MTEGNRLPVDRVDSVAPGNAVKGGWSTKHFLLLELVSMALLFVLFELEDTLSSLVFWSLITVVGLATQAAAYGLVGGFRR